MMAREAEGSRIAKLALPDDLRAFIDQGGRYVAVHPSLVTMQTLREIDSREKPDDDSQCCAVAHDVSQAKAMLSGQSLYGANR